MKILSWNVAGINACIKKDLFKTLKEEGADIYCFQEVKATLEKMPDFNKEFPQYHQYHAIANKKGYSGVSILSKIKPINVIDKLKIPKFDDEGRILILEYPSFFLINAYFPHAHRELTRLSYKLEFNSEFLKLCNELKKRKPLIIASDYNVAHTSLDLANPKQNEKNAGYTKEERSWFDNFLGQGFIDTFRLFNNEGGNYTWWTYRNNARQRNIGWRIDYMIVSNEIKDRVKSSTILKDRFGSDHCPTMLEIELK